MREQKNFDNPTTPPDVQEIILSGRIGIISSAIAERLNIEPIRALEMFYESKTCLQLHNRATGLYLYGNNYIVDEFIIETQNEQ